MMSKKEQVYRAVIFDLDGTLLDTLQDIGDSMNTVLRERGCTVHPYPDYKYLTGMGIYFLVERALPEGKRDKESVEKCVQRMKEEYSKRWARKTRPYKGIPQLLDELSRKEIKMNILSNKIEEFTQKITQKFLGKWKFENVIGVKPCLNRKPDPQGALQISDNLGLPPSQFIYLGDTSTDMKTARAAGMKAVGALWGFRSKEELIKSGAQGVINNPLELLKFFP